MPARPDAPIPATPVAAPSLMTVREVASLLSMSERSVWRAAAAGDLPKPLQIRGCSRWIRDEVETVIRKAASRR